MTPSKEPELTDFARLVADAVASVIEARGISKRELARQVGRSNNYVAMRFRHEAAFTLTDIDVICAALDLDAGSFIAGVSRPANITPLNVPGSGETRSDYGRAARPRAKDRGEDLE